MGVHAYPVALVRGAVDHDLPWHCLAVRRQGCVALPCSSGPAVGVAGERGPALPRGRRTTLPRYRPPWRSGPTLPIRYLRGCGTPEPGVVRRTEQSDSDLMHPDAATASGADGGPAQLRVALVDDAPAIAAALGVWLGPSAEIVAFRRIEDLTASAPLTVDVVLLDLNLNDARREDASALLAGIRGVREVVPLGPPVRRSSARRSPVPCAGCWPATPRR